MGSENNFLRLDPYNYDTEIEYLLGEGMFNYDDCVALYENKQMSEEDFQYCKEFFGYEL